MNVENITAIDAHLSDRMRIADQPGVLRNIAAFLAHSGDSWFWLAGLVILWFVGDGTWKVRALIITSAILGTAVLVMTLKFSIRRSRPEGEWGQIYRKTDPHSFPSGHAARGILIGVVALGVGPVWFGVLLIIWGPLVGLARVAMGVHYLSDILAGWIVGIAMGIITLNFFSF